MCVRNRAANKSQFLHSFLKCRVLITQPRFPVGYFEIYPFLKVACSGDCRFQGGN